MIKKIAGKIFWGTMIMLLALFEKFILFSKFDYVYKIVKVESVGYVGRGSSLRWQYKYRNKVYEDSNGGFTKEEANTLKYKELLIKVSTLFPSRSKYILDNYYFITFLKKQGKEEWTEKEYLDSKNRYLKNIEERRRKMNDRNME